MKNSAKQNAAAWVAVLTISALASPRAFAQTDPASTALQAAITQLEQIESTGQQQLEKCPKAKAALQEAQTPQPILSNAKEEAAAGTAAMGAAKTSVGSAQGGTNNTSPMTGAGQGGQANGAQAQQAFAQCGTQAAEGATQIQQANMALQQAAAEDVLDGQQKITEGQQMISTGTADHDESEVDKGKDEVKKGQELVACGPKAQALGAQYQAAAAQATSGAAACGAKGTGATAAQQVAKSVEKAGDALKGAQPSGGSPSGGSPSGGSPSGGSPTSPPSSPQTAQNTPKTSESPNPSPSETPRVAQADPTPAATSPPALNPATGTADQIAANGATSEIPGVAPGTPIDDALIRRTLANISGADGGTVAANGTAGSASRAMAALTAPGAGGAVRGGGGVDTSMMDGRALAAISSANGASGLTSTRSFYGSDLGILGSSNAAAMERDGAVGYFNKGYVSNVNGSGADTFSAGIVRALAAPFDSIVEIGDYCRRYPGVNRCVARDRKDGLLQQ